MNVVEIMSRQLIAIRRDALVSEGAQLMTRALCPAPSDLTDPKEPRK